MSQSRIENYLDRGFLALEDKEWNRADSFFEKVLDQESRNAQAYLGKMMAENCIPTTDRIKNCSRMFFTSKNYAKCMRFGDDKLKEMLNAAVVNFKDILAKYGEPFRQIMLGAVYSRGVLVKRDYAEAVKWFRKAAEQGNYLGQYDLAVMYDQGLGVEKDFTEAAKWYRRSAEQGYCEAQKNLGVMYCVGEGVEKDYAEAFKWFWEAFSTGDIQASFHIGNMYYLGMGVKKDYSEAERWYRLAAEEGDKDAIAMLEKLKGNK